MHDPLFLIPGLLSNEYLWQHQVKHLTDSAEIMMYLPTQNSSEKIVEDFLKTAPPRFALAGHSMGGWLCLEILRAAPTRVSKLCLLNTTARDDSKAKKVKRQEMIQRSKNGQFEEIVEELASFFTNNPQLELDIRQMFLDVGSQIFIRQEEAMLNRSSCESILRSIQCPTLVIHAAQDKNFTIEEHVELVEKIPDAKLAIVEDSGHMSPLEMPQAITSLLRFWLTYF